MAEYAVGYPTSMTNPSDETQAHPGTPRESEAEETDGQVSETADMSDGPQPISDGDTVSAAPTDESGGGYEGPTGPEANYNKGASET